MDVYIESDEDTEIDDLRQLTAVLESDNVSQVESAACSSIASSSTACSTILLECSKIESAIALNKMTDEKLKRLEGILIKRLQECRSKLQDLQNPLIIDKLNKESFSYIHCRQPYFKDRNNFPAPKNSDTLLMEKSHIFDFASVTSIPGWTVKDKSELIELIKKTSYKLKHKEIQSKITQLERLAKTEDSKPLQKEIVTLKNTLEEVDSMDFDDVALPLDQEYDWDSIANKLSHRHTASEYRALWKLFLHPTINKSCWSKHEHSKLQEIGKFNKFQDWDRIAEQLQTGRTGYQCFVYYRTNVSTANAGKKWSKEEVEYLKRLIDYYKEGEYIPWAKVAATMENRTKVQIYNKYRRLQNYRKGRFLREEDTVLLNCVDKFGTDFKKIKMYLPGRSEAQLGARYKSLVNKFSYVWTIEEDKKLLQLMSNQDYESYSSIVKYFPGKDRVTIRGRFLTLEKWVRRNPNVDISFAPRRAARRLGHGKPTENLNRAVENLKVRITNEVENTKLKKVTKKSPEEVLDDAIITTLYNERLKEDSSKIVHIEDKTNDTENRCLAVSSQSLNASNLKNLLILLKARLNKELFYGSFYSSMFPMDKEPEVSLVKMKSYSKKENVTAINIPNLPDLWGNVTLNKPTEYVLPPNYATLTGCKKLLSFTKLQSEKKELHFNISLMMKKNPCFKTQLSNLMERFNLLFLWPLLLSNEGPVDQRLIANRLRATKCATEKKSNNVDQGGIALFFSSKQIERMEKLATSGSQGPDIIMDKRRKLPDNN